MFQAKLETTSLKEQQQNKSVAEVILVEKVWREICKKISPTLSRFSATVNHIVSTWLIDHTVYIISSPYLIFKISASVAIILCHFKSWHDYVIYKYHMENLLATLWDPICHQWLNIVQDRYTIMKIKILCENWFYMHSELHENSCLIASKRSTSLNRYRFYFCCLINLSFHRILTILDNK